ncbi:hypothetical protein M426DRAFT_12499 [Hypoxylon sp. CI-4A]|nr:hypothetical protein M426DRAFT_12499 [Hypoxylon sp. CI-4A]
MANFSHEAAFEAALQAGEIPGVALVATDVTGKFNYAKAFGKTAHGETITADSVFWIASCTKLMTSVATLQQVERGSIGLDDDVSKILPELAAQKILKGFDEEGKPLYEDRQVPITVKHLLTHTSGSTAPLFNANLAKLAELEGPPAKPPRTVVEECSIPLVFQPGTSWHYGMSLDWAGQLVERLSGLSLEEYMRANIWEPLGMEHVSFLPESKDEIKARMVGMSAKGKDGKVAATTEGYIFHYKDRDDAYGGASGWASAESYLKLLQTLCANDGRVLGKEIVDEMFRTQLSPETKKAFNDFVQSSDFSRQLAGNSFDMDHQVLDWGLGGELSTVDEAGYRKKGTLSWGGLPNLIWWIDRETGLCGALFTNMVPAADAKIVELMRLFEKAIYKEYEEFKSHS